jgi:uncharacterized protein (DUF1778 family)
VAGMALAKSRLDLRIDNEDRSLIEQAAAIARQSLSDFIIPTAVHKARRIIKQHHTTVLSERDWKAFLEMLDSDAAPNAALRKAISRYNRAYGKA